MARWIAVASRCEKEDGLDSGHPIPTLTSSSPFSQFLPPPLLSWGKDRGKGGWKENPVNTTSF